MDMIHDHKRLTARFFQSVNDPDLFKEFFEKFGVWDKLEVPAKPKNDQIHAQWNILDHPKRKEIEEHLCCMNDISVEEGREWLYTIAATAKIDGYKDMTLPKLAMKLWLHHGKHFQAAYEYFILEKLDNLKVLVGRDSVPCNPSESQLAEFRSKLQTLLKKAGEGPRLRTDVGPHPPGKWVLVIPHEEHKKPDYEFKNETEIATRERRPVFELVLIYYPDKGIVKIKAGKGKSKTDAVAAAFASAILGRRMDHFQIVEIVKFDPLFRPEFNFQKRVEDQFDWAKPVELKFKPKSNLNYSMVIHCHDTLGGRQDVIDQLKLLGYSPANINVESLSVQFQFPGGGKKKRRTVTLAQPNKYNLDETARDRYLEEVLMRWGFIDVNAKITTDVTEVAG